jgi:hypothetical protein
VAVDNVVVVLVVPLVELPRGAIGAGPFAGSSTVSMM